MKWGGGYDHTNPTTSTFRLYYRLNDISISEDYLDNRSCIDYVLSQFEYSPRIDSIIIYSYTSPEGPYARNAWLSGRRAEAARDFLVRSIPEGSSLNPDNILIHTVPEYWDGLRESVEEDYDGPDRQAALEIIDSDLPDDRKEAKLKRLSSGKTWRLFVEKYMPRLRRAEWKCVWVEEKHPDFQKIPDIGTTPSDTLLQPFVPLEPEIVMHRRQQWRTAVALKTNMLSDAVTALNFSVEVPVNKHFSVLYQQYCPWWNIGNRYALQILSFGGEARWWFLPRPKEWYHPDVRCGKYRQRDALTGHFLGLYGMGGKFDIQAGRNVGCYQNYFWSAGLTYGYSMPVSRSLNIEFSLSAGYACIDYTHYVPADDWSVLYRDDSKIGRLHYFGPTKAEISLVIPIRAKIKGGDVR